MLRERSPLFRVWLVLAIGAVAPGVMSLLGHPAREVFTLDSLLELIRVGISGAFSALFALFVEKPRQPVTRERIEDPAEAAAANLVDPRAPVAIGDPFSEVELPMTPPAGEGGNP